MKVVTALEMERIESRDLALRRMTENDLILSVAMSMEDFIVHDHPDQVLLLCGPGRNGDYGLMTAHLLAQNPSIKVTVVSTTLQGNRYYRMLLDDEVEFVTVQRIIREQIAAAPYIVDFIYGCQDNGRMDYPYNYWINWVNEAQGFVFSCDVPSGLNCDNGSVTETAIKADRTMAIQLPKAGMYMYPGYEYVGELIIESVGYSYDSISANNTVIRTTEKADIAGKLPQRRAHSHKGTYGKVLLMAGNTNTPGACLLCARAILKTGAGLLTVMSSREVLNLVNNNLYEAMSLPIQEDYLPDQLEQLNLDKYSLLVIGPGLGVNRRTELMLEKVLKSDLPCVIDADGLYYLKDHLDMLKREPLTVITPHEVEYDRIFGFNRSTIMDDLRRITAEYPSLVIVFKGEHTLIGYQGTVTINMTGNNALAKGGSGDVLTGIIAGFMAQDVSADAVEAAVYVHSLAADRWVSDQSPYSMLASELITGLDEAITEVMRASR